MMYIRGIGETYFIHSSLSAVRPPEIVASERTSLDSRVTSRVRNTGAVRNMIQWNL